MLSRNPWGVYTLHIFPSRSSFKEILWSFCWPQSNLCLLKNCQNFICRSRCLLWCRWESDSSWGFFGPLFETETRWHKKSVPCTTKISRFDNDNTKNSNILLKKNICNDFSHQTTFFLMLVVLVKKIHRFFFRHISGLPKRNLSPHPNAPALHRLHHRNQRLWQDDRGDGRRDRIVVVVFWVGFFVGGVFF